MSFSLWFNIRRSWSVARRLWFGRCCDFLLSRAESRTGRDMISFHSSYQITDFKAAPHKTSQRRLIRCVRLCLSLSLVIFTRSSSSSHQTLNKCKCACLGFSVHHSTRFVFMKDTMNVCLCAPGKSIWRIQKHPSLSVNRNEEKMQWRERSLYGN